MSILILQTVLLLCGAFLVSAGLGWMLAGRAMSEQSAFEKRPRAVFSENTESVPEVAMAAVSAVEPEPEQRIEAPVMETVAAPVSVPEDIPEDVAEVATEDIIAETPEISDADDLDQVVKQFTSGVIVPFKMPDNGHSAYAPPSVAPKLDMVAAAPAAVANVVIEREDTSLQRRVSSLAGMTPESIEAAVQQVGSGLEPVRLSAPQGKPDDLTVISGVAESNQRELNALGIYHYWQIAGWSPEHVAWISNRILFPKRVVRENWMSQAARLAKLT